MRLPLPADDYLCSVTGLEPSTDCNIASKIKVTPKGVYLPISKLHSILGVANLLAHNNISQICYCGQISLQSAAVNCSFSDTFGGNIYFAGDGTIKREAQERFCILRFLKATWHALVSRYRSPVWFYWQSNWERVPSVVGAFSDACVTHRRDTILMWK